MIVKKSRLVRRMKKYGVILTRNAMFGIGYPYPKNKYILWKYLGTAPRCKLEKIFDELVRVNGVK